jgi:hypothetical protein
MNKTIVHLVSAVSYDESYFLSELYGKFPDDLRMCDLYDILWFGNNSFLNYHEKIGTTVEDLVKNIYELANEYIQKMLSHVKQQVIVFTGTNVYFNKEKAMYKNKIIEFPQNKKLQLNETIKLFIDFDLKENIKNIIKRDITSLSRDSDFISDEFMARPEKAKQIMNSVVDYVTNTKGITDEINEWKNYFKSQKYTFIKLNDLHSKIKQLIPTQKYYYHGSSNKIEILEPRPSAVINNESAVFATNSKVLSILFIARASGCEIEIGYYGDKLYALEVTSGMFNKYLDTSGYVHMVESKYFKSDNRLGMKNSEFISDKNVPVVNVEYIPNLYSELRKYQFDMITFEHKMRALVP